MASIIKIKRSTTSSSVPASLQAGELAINIPDKKLFSSDGTTVFEIGDTTLAATVASNLANTNAYIASVQSDVDTNEATELSHLANTNAYIAAVQSDVDTNEATELSHLANTNAYIATKVSTSTFNSALANTNAYIAAVQSDVDTNESTELSHLANTNAYIATKVDTSTFNSALANTNAYIASVQSSSGSWLANTNAYIASVQSDVDTNEATELSHLANTNAYIATKVDTSTFNSALANTNSYIATKANASSPTTSGFFDHSGRLTVGTNLRVSGNTVIDGNLTVEGEMTYISTSVVKVDDSMIKLAANNTADSIDTGVYGYYVDGATDKWSGYFRDATDGVFKFYKGLETEPTTTVNTGATGYTLATVEAVIDGGTY